MEGVSPGHFSETCLMLAGQSLNPDDDLKLFIHDALHFISAFMVPISQSAPHVYLSALPFAPEESHVARKFSSRFPNTFMVTEGKASQWPTVAFTAEHHKGAVWNVAFSPDESTFSSRSEDATYICDSETGRRILGPFDHAPYARFSPTGKHILLQYSSYAVVWDIEMGEEQFQIEGSDFAFVHHDGRIASMKKDGNSDDFGDKAWIWSWATGATRILVEFWDASNSKLISSRSLEVNDVDHVRFSPDGHFLAIQKRSKDVLELWNLEDSKDFQQFTCPRGYFHFSPGGQFLAIRKKPENLIELWNLKDSKDFPQFTYPCGDVTFLRFSPTSDTLVVRSDWHRCQIYLWRLDTQEMVSLSCDWSFIMSDRLHVIHSPLTNHLFILPDERVELWDVSATGSKMIWKAASHSRVSRICPSRNGHRVLVGYEDGSVRMWNLDLENLAINQADTMDILHYTNLPRVIAISPSGKMAITRQFSNAGILDTDTGKVVARTHIEFDTDMVFSPNEDQVAFMDRFLTICDITHPDKRVSFNPWQEKYFCRAKVAFQTCNDLVICVTSLGLLQVWHRQDPAGFECTSSLDIRDDLEDAFLAPDGLTVVTVYYLFNTMSSGISRSVKCYSWNHDTAKFDHVDFDDQVYIFSSPSPAYPPDGKLFACWSPDDSHIRVWDTRTGHLVSKFPTSRVDKIALSPALIDHSLGERLVALSSRHECVIRLFDAYTGHLRAQILDRGNARVTFLQDGTALASYYDNFVRFWKIENLTTEHRYSTEPTMQDGWMMSQDDEPLFWIPVENRRGLYVLSFKVLIKGPEITTILDLSNSRFGRKWTECIDKGWLRELKQKEKEVGKLLQ